MSFASHSPSSHNRTQAKDLVIIPTADLLLRFYQSLGGLVLPPGDMEEILTQITWTLLNADSQPDVDGELRKLPDASKLVYFNRMLSEQHGGHQELLERGEQFAGFQQAVWALAFAVRDRLAELGAYHDRDFPYFLDRLLDWDVVLAKIPF